MKPISFTDDPPVEIQSSAMSITDSMYHDSEPSYLILSARRIARARGIRRFDANVFGSALFDYFREENIKLLAEELDECGLQFDIKPVEQASIHGDGASTFLRDITLNQPHNVATGLATLGLCFDVEPKRPAVDRLWEDHTGQLNGCCQSNRKARC